MAAPITRNDDTDTLASLEDRILRAVEAVNRLRQEKEAADARAEAATAEAARLTEEVEALRAERKQVRGRLEKLLGQLDSLAS
jgi:uncharacterized coiled-coil DUF342 family protein